MDGLLALGLLSAGYPLLRAWKGLRGCTLRNAVVWAGAAWVAWTAAGLNGPPAAALDYLALSLTACAGVAVLGARRPGVGAWHFVVAGLLAALLRPLFEGLGRLRLEAPHLAFLGGVFAVGTVNYLPTRFGPAALVLAGGWGWELARLAEVVGPGLFGRGLIALAPWLALMLTRPRPISEIDVTWRRFRDRFGLVWGLRCSEQFNRAAANAGWPVVLEWGGLRSEGGPTPDPDKILALLRGLLRRFEVSEP